MRGLSRWLSLLAVAVGTVVRSRQYFSGRSFWLDEASIVDNLESRGYRRLVGPLAGHQGAPIGWLYAERTLAVAFGPSEYVLRLLSFLAGLALLVVAWDVGRRVLPSPLRPVLVLAVALSPGLIRYSSEVKQYESDALAVLAVLDGALLVAARPSGGVTRGRAAACGGLAAVAVLCSHAATLATVGVGLALLAHRAVLRDRAGLVTLAAAGVLPAAALGVQYLATLRYLSGDQTLTRYWRAGYPPTPLRARGLAHWAPGASRAFVADPVHMAYPVLVGVLLLLGAVVLVRRWPVALVLVLAPAAVQLAAALAHRYPFSGRLALDLVPLTLLLLVASLARVLTARLPVLAVGAAACAALAALLVGPVRTAVRLTAHPLTITEFRPLMSALARQDRPGQRVLVFWAAGAAARLYADRAGIRVDGYTGVFPSTLPCDTTWVSAALSRGPVWVVDATLDPATAPGPSPLGRSQDVARFRAAWRKLAVPRTVIERPGVAAVLYTARRPRVSSPAGGGCLQLLP